MGKRHRQHVNPLKMSCLAARQTPLELPPAGAVEVELGCADARFLIQRAQEYPERTFVGVDIREAFLTPARAAVEAMGQGNLVLALSNLMVDAGGLFPPRRIRRFYINFPDPWFKARHKNRRWLNETTLSQLVHALEPGGEIFLQSDYFPLTLEALALMEAHQALQNVCGAWTFLRENPFGARSSRELLCIEEEREIWRILFSADGSAHRALRSSEQDGVEGAR